MSTTRQITFTDLRKEMETGNRDQTPSGFVVPDKIKGKYSTSKEKSKENFQYVNLVTLEQHLKWQLFHQKLYIGSLRYILCALVFILLVFAENDTRSCRLPARALEHAT